MVHYGDTFRQNPRKIKIAAEGNYLFRKRTHLSMCSNWFPEFSISPSRSGLNTY